MKNKIRIVLLNLIPVAVIAFLTILAWNSLPDLKAAVPDVKEIWLYSSVIALSLSGFAQTSLHAHTLIGLEEAKKSLEERIAAIEATFDGIGIVDKDGRLTYMNKALMRLHGIETNQAEHYVGESWTSLYSEKGQQDIESFVLPHLQKNGYWRGEAPILRLDKEIAYAELSLTALPDGGFIGTARDITENKKAEKEKEVLQAQFYQAQKMEGIGRLAGGIAHDFNNTLAAISGYAEFLVDDLEKDTWQYKFAQKILLAGAKARGLIDQMLAFSRRRESGICRFDMLRPVHETFQLMKASLPKTIEVSMDIRISNPSVSGNISQISQLLMNLCLNARDAMEEQRGRLTIGVRMAEERDYLEMEVNPEMQPGAQEITEIRIEEIEQDKNRLFLGAMESGREYICVFVKDTGAGMSRVVMEHIFEPFFTTRSADKGSGLGLSTVRSITASHKGAIVVESKAGEGSLFKIYFPLAPGDMPVKITSETPGLRGKTHILLVENQEELQGMLITALERLGFYGTTAKDGFEALALLRKNPDEPDLVIASQNMPGMTGVELVQEALHDFPSLPFIIISGHDDKKLQESMKKYPAIKGILQKPVLFDSLAQKINHVLAFTPFMPPTQDYKG